MKWRMLYAFDGAGRRVHRDECSEECIETETVEETKQKYEAFKISLKAMNLGGQVFGLERIDQEEVVTKIL